MQAPADEVPGQVELLQPQLRVVAGLRVRREAGQLVAGHVQTGQRRQAPHGAGDAGQVVVAQHQPAHGQASGEEGGGEVMQLVARQVQSAHGARGGLAGEERGGGLADQHAADVGGRAGRGGGGGGGRGRVAAAAVGV